MPLGVFEALAAGRVEFGVVPQENSIFGSVVETYDSLRHTEDISVCGETTIRIDHCLIVHKGAELGDIRHVLSHEQVRSMSLTRAWHSFEWTT